MRKILLFVLMILLNTTVAYAYEVEKPEILIDRDNGPYLWVSAETGLESIDGKTVWRDLSGNNNHMEAVGNPQVKERAINQRPAMILSSHTNQYFSVDFPEKYVGDATIFIVANMKEFAAYKGLFSTSTPSQDRQLNTFEAYFLNNQIEGASLNKSASDINKDVLFTNADGGVFGKYHTFIVTEYDASSGNSKRTAMKTYYGVYNKQNDTTTLRNMVNTTNRNKGLSVGLYNTFVGFSLGGRSDFSYTTPESEFAEAIVFKRALSEDEIQEVADYLSEKYYKAFPPIDGIEFDMTADKKIEENEAVVSVTMKQVEGSVFDKDYYIIAQLYEDEEYTRPFDILIKRKSEEAVFRYNKNLFAKIMAFTEFGAEDEENIGTNIAHPINQ